MILPGTGRYCEGLLTAVIRNAVRVPVEGAVHSVGPGAAKRASLRDLSDARSGWACAGEGVAVAPGHPLVGVKHEVLGVLL